MAGNLVEWIQKRLLEKDQNYIAAITGGTGSGKSFSGLRLCSQIDPQFNKTKIVFNIEDLLKLLNTKGALKPGAAVLFEEAGVSMDNRRWQSLMNRVATYVTETYRHRNTALILTTPTLDRFDLKVRKLLHHWFKTIFIDREHQFCRCKIYQMRWNDIKQKFYTPYPTIDDNGRKRRLTTIDFSKPGEALIDDYLELKHAFTNELNLGLQQDILESKVEKVIGKKVNVKPMVAEVLKNPERFYSKKPFRGRKIIDFGRVMAHFDVGETLGKRIKKSVEMSLEDVGS